MDQKTETWISDIKKHCQHYCNDYTFFSNSFEKMATLIILQADDLKENYQKNTLFFNIMHICFMEAIIRVLEEAGSKRLLHQLRPLSVNHKAGNIVKSNYEQEIASFCMHLKKSNGLFSNITLFDMDVFMQKYQSLSSQNVEKSYRLEVLGESVPGNKRLTAEDVDAIDALLFS